MVGPDNGDETPNDRTTQNGEGPISPDRLENRNKERRNLVVHFHIHAEDEAEVEIKTDGGTRDLFTRVSEDHIRKLIILCTLVLLSVTLWRLGALVRIVSWMRSIIGI